MLPRTDSKRAKQMRVTYIVWNGQLMRASLCRGIHPSWSNTKKPHESADLVDYYKYTVIAFPLSTCTPTLEALVAMCNGEGALLHGQLVKFGELLKQRQKEQTHRQTIIRKHWKHSSRLKYFFPFVRGCSDNVRKSWNGTWDPWFTLKF